MKICQNCYKQRCHVFKQLLSLSYSHFFNSSLGRELSLLYCETLLKTLALEDLTHIYAYEYSVAEIELETYSQTIQ
jgi:hypothetical protein